MRASRYVIAICGSVIALAPPAFGQRAGNTPSDDPRKVLVGRLDLERYKATIKGLAKFGDRQQGTDRNRAAVDWIEAQLKSYGCANVQRLKYVFNQSGSQFQPAAAMAPAQEIASGEIRGGLGGARLRGIMRLPE